MKTLKNSLTALAVVFALGAAFAFTPTNPMEMTNAFAQDPSCTPVTVDERCNTVDDAILCTVQLIPGGATFNTVKIQSDCQNQPILGRASQ